MARYVVFGIITLAIVIVLASLIASAIALLAKLGFIVLVVVVVWIYWRLRHSKSAK
ncbi:MAG: hypothetical protein ACP5OV_00930 [Acidimicrobiales bacterium]